MRHALRKALGVIAVLQGRGQAAGTAAVDWDDPGSRDGALAEVLSLLERVEAFVAGQAGDEAAATAVAAACQVRDQDVDLTGPAPSLRRGVVRDRRISVEDSQMRHGRKSRSVLFDGYKRHVLRDLGTGLIPAGRGRVHLVRAAYRPGLPVLGAGPRPRPGPGRLLQGLAGPQRRRPVRQGPVHPRLRCRAADLPRRGEYAVRARQDRAVPERHLRGLPAAAAAPGAASPSTPTRHCSPNCASASRPGKGARNCANASQSSMRWPTSGTGRAAAPATWAPARTYSTCASPWSTTFTSSPASLSPMVTS